MAYLNLKTAGIKPLRKTPPNAILPYLRRWQSNNSVDDLGVVRFIFDIIYLNNKMGLLPILKDFKPEYGIAPWAKKSLAAYYEWGKGMTKEDRCFAIETYREGSKTFWWSFESPVYEVLVGQYGIYFNNELFPEMDYQVFRAKNGREAKKRLMNISSFLNNKIITDLFGTLKPTFQEVKSKDAKDTGELLILNNKYIFEASGIDQPSRGLNIFQMRPKKMLFDDPQNRENTKTLGRREQCDNEVMQESFAAVSDEGSIIYVGNRIHSDDTLDKLMSNENTAWRKFKYALTMKKDGSPGDGDLENEVPEWKARWTIEKVRKRKEWFIKQPKLGGLRGYYKEFYNILKSDANYKIQIHNATYHREFGINWLKFPLPDGSEKIVNCNIYIGNDPAISQRKESSDSSIAVTAITPDARRYVLEISKGKYDINDRYYQQYKEEMHNVPLAQTAEDIAKIERRGNVGEVARMHMKYNSDGITIETFGQQGTFFNDTKALLNDRLLSFPSMLPYAKGQDKTEKLREVPLSYFEIDLYYIRESMTDLQNEIDSFGEGSRKDILDSLFLAEQLMQIPQAIQYNPMGIRKAVQKESTEPALISHKQQGMLTNDYESWIIF